MKIVSLILSMAALTVLASCNQNIDANALLENAETRTEIINAIAANHSYMIEFMDAMQTNDHAMQMMQGDQKMMSHMMKGEGMQMMMKDSTTMTNMMQNMMKNGKMMGKMMQMMHEKGMMGVDCMESCMDLMTEKGMDMEGMGMMDDGTMKSKVGDHSEHH